MKNKPVERHLQLAATCLAWRHVLPRALVDRLLDSQLLTFGKTTSIQTTQEDVPRFLQDMDMFLRGMGTFLRCHHANKTETIVFFQRFNQEAEIQQPHETGASKH